VMKIRVALLAGVLMLGNAWSPLRAQTIQAPPETLAQIQSATLLLDAALLRGDTAKALEFLAPDFEVGHAQYRPRNRAWMTHVLPMLLAQARFGELGVSVTSVETQEGKTFGRGRIELSTQERAGTRHGGISGGYSAQWTSTAGDWRLRRDDALFNALLNVATVPAAPLVLPVESRDAKIGLVRENPAVVIEQPHQDRIEPLVFSPDGKTLASYDPYNPLRLSSAQSGALLRSLKTPMSINSLCYAPNGTLFTGHNDGHVRAWNTQTGEQKSDLEVSKRNVDALAVSPDGKTLAADGDLNVQLWDIASGRKLRELSQTVGNLAFSPDGRSVAFDGKGGVEVCGVEGQHQHLFANETWLGFTRDGGFVTGAFGTLQVRSPAGALERKISIPNPFLPPVEEHFNGVVSVSRMMWEPTAQLSPDGRTVASIYEDGSIGVWDLGSGQLKHLLRGFQSRADFNVMSGEVMSLAFSPDGSRLAAGSRSGEAAIWNLTGATP